MDFKLLKMKIIVHYLHLFKKIGKLNEILSLPFRSGYNSRLMVIFPVDEPSFRVAIFSFRRFNEQNNRSVHFTYLVPEKFRNIFQFTGIDVVYFDEGKMDEMKYDKKYDIIIDLNLQFHLSISKFMSHIHADYKIGFQSEFSDKFYNIQLDVRENDSLEKSYHRIHGMLLQI